MVDESAAACRAATDADVRRVRGVVATIPAAGAVAVALLGAVVLVGWLAGIESLKSILPGARSMKFNTAIAFLLSGAALLLLDRPRALRARHAIRRVLVAGVALLALATLSQYLLAVDLGIDQALHADDPGAPHTANPGRMAPVSALDFVLFSAGILGLETRGRLRLATDVLTVIAALLALLGLVGYLYSAASLTEVFGYSGFSLHSGAGLLVLGTAILHARPEEGILRVVAAEGEAASWARVLLATAVFVPLVFGWLRLAGERLQLYGTSYGTGIYAVSMVVVFGGLVLWSASALSASERARREAEEVARHGRLRLQTILDHTVAVICLKEPGGRYILVNRQFENVVGRSQLQILGLTDADLLGEEVAAQIREDDLRAMEEGTQTQERTYDLPGGRRTFLVSKFPIEDPERGRVLCAVSVDITDRLEMESDLRRARDEAQVVGKELETFAYSVSHDLRSPLRALDGFSLALLEDCGDRLDEAGKEYLGRIRAAAQRMGILIDDLLDLSRVGRAEMERVTVDLTAVARGVAEELSRAHPRRRIEWRIAEGLRAEGDVRLLRIALENLLGNAVKYTGRKESAVIELGAEGSNGSAAFFVRDDGAGFDPRFANRLFTPFQRLHREAEFPGSGIGLATVERIVRRHGGTVSAEGVPDGGATFRFTLGGGRPA